MSRLRSLPGARPAATAVGLVASRFLPPIPDEAHPVAQFGEAMARVEDLIYVDDRQTGMLYAGIGAFLGASGAGATQSTAATVTMCAAGHQLRMIALEIAEHLDEEDLDAAREVLPALVGRDTTNLDHSGIAAATIESVAENMVDATFAPALWGATAGALGAGVHRALNTMDAMVGRKDERYGNFGWAAAKADDAAAWLPARLFVAAMMTVVPRRATDIWRAVRDDAPAHPSPNAGVAEAAMAAALGVELGGPLRYGPITENRPYLGAGFRPGVSDLRHAVAIAERTENLLIAVLAGTAAFRWLRATRHARVVSHTTRAMRR